MLKSFKDKAHLARQLSLLDWLTLAEAWWLLFFFYLAIRKISFERLLNQSLPISEKKTNPYHALIIAQRFQRLVGFASRLHLMPMTCLIKSLTLQKILSRQNISAQVKIGAQKIQAVIVAHAWVEVDGKPIGEADDVSQKFHVLESTDRLINF